MDENWSRLQKGIVESKKIMQERYRADEALNAEALARMEAKANRVVTLVATCRRDAA